MTENNKEHYFLQVCRGLTDEYTKLMMFDTEQEAKNHMEGKQYYDIDGTYKDMKMVSKPVNFPSDDNEIGDRLGEYFIIKGKFVK